MRSWRESETERERERARERARKSIDATITYNANNFIVKKLES